MKIGLKFAETKSPVEYMFVRIEKQFTELFSKLNRRSSR